MQISKHFSACIQREGDKEGRRDREVEYSLNDDEGRDEPAERGSSSFPMRPQRREQYTPCFVCHTKTKISAVYTLLMKPKIRVSTPVAPAVGQAVCLQLFDNVVFFLTLFSHSHTILCILYQNITQI